GPAEFGDLNPTYSKFTIEKRAVAEPKDILVTCKGAGLGKLNVVNVEIAISRQLMAIRTVRANCDYFKLLLSSMYDYF
ncbi:restriction endonuclease subunit S, partial [Escherichia coli]|nr:restriction endonuclease subunit S [Escherichia coli]